MLANALTDDGPVGQTARGELAQDVRWASPEHLIVEVFSAVRGRVLGRKLEPGRGRDALDAMADSAIELVPTTPLLRRM